MDVVGADPFAGARLSTAVAVVGENVAHMPVLAGADLQRQDIGRFQSRFAITLGQGQQPQAGRMVFGAVSWRAARYNLTFSRPRILEFRFPVPQRSL